MPKNKGKVRTDSMVEGQPRYLSRRDDALQLAANDLW
jgi:hypothetical protein